MSKLGDYVLNTDVINTNVVKSIDTESGGGGNVGAKSVLLYSDQASNNISESCHLYVDPELNQLACYKDVEGAIQISYKLILSNGSKPIFSSFYISDFKEGNSLIFDVLDASGTRITGSWTIDETGNHFYFDGQ